MDEQPLADVRVLDCGQIYNGPYCGLLLAQMGADVIKVEPPGGERVRTRVDDGEPEELVMVNSCKRGMTLNLKDERGTAIFKQLVAASDVLIENFSTGTMSSLGVGYETLSAESPELVYAQSSGYGRDGPKSNRLALDLAIQASAGVIDATGWADGPPVKTGSAVGDFLGGTHLAAGVLAALYERERTGEGQLVEVGMYDAVVPSMLSQLAIEHRNPDVPNRTGNRHSGQSKAPYNAYKTADGYVVIICVTDTHWEQLLRIMGREDCLGDERFDSNVKRVSHIDAVDEMIESWTQDKETDAIETALLDEGIPCGAVQSVADVLDDEHLYQRGTLHEMSHPTYGDITVLGSPVKFPESEEQVVHPAPTNGQHTAAVLSEVLGMDAETVAGLAEDGVV